MYKVYDDVKTPEGFDMYNFLLYQNAYNYGETDRPGVTPTGMVFDISDPKLLDWFNNVATENDTRLDKSSLQKSYVNLFQPHERPYWHTDGDCWTCLFYITPDHDVEEGGETQFIIDDEIRGVLPKKDRLIVFDGQLKHRATSYRTQPRITVALKYKK